MDNQHQKIKGYRDLSQAEIDLMNTIKEESVLIEGLIKRVGGHLNAQYSQASRSIETQDEEQRLDYAEPQRWLAMARSDFQVAFMKLVRAVAQPTTF